jgi:uncharacterized membrane protein YhaH (DUF805 family)
MFTFFFSPLGKIAQPEFVYGWLFWFTAELACLTGFAAAASQSPAQTYWFLIGVITSGLSTVSVTLLGMKRLRDAGMPVWVAAVLLVPGLSLIALVVLSNMPSKSGNSTSPD